MHARRLRPPVVASVETSYASEASRDMLERRIAARLPDAAVDDLLIPSYSYLVGTRYFLEGRDVADEGNEEEGSEAETPGTEASR